MKSYLTTHNKITEVYMAEVNVAELPVILESEFTINDRFLIVDDGKIRLLTKAVFESWLAANVKGTQGEQGASGLDGINGARGIDGANGANGLSAYQIAVSDGFVGNISAWRLSLKGDKGTKGEDGLNGWSPSLKAVSRDGDIVIQVVDWLGGTGVKPTALGYLSDTGIVSNIANATNIRGTKGLKGDTGEAGASIKGDTGATGSNGVDGKSLSDVLVNADSSIKLTFTDATTITSNIPERLTGWGTYKDGEYTKLSPFVVATGSQSNIPNNSIILVENLPKGYSSLFNKVTQKYTMSEANGYYGVRVKFKVLESTPSSFINVNMNGGTSEVLYSEDRPLRGDNQTQSLSFSTEIYGGSALATNGLSINVKTYDRAVSIYDIEVTIAKLI